VVNKLDIIQSGSESLFANKQTLPKTVRTAATATRPTSSSWT
jgi:hypothetical protein